MGLFRRRRAKGGLISAPAMGAPAGDPSFFVKNFIALQISSLPVKVYTTSGGVEREQTSGRLYKLAQSPSLFYSQQLFYYELTKRLLDDGHALALLVEDKKTFKLDLINKTAYTFLYDEYEQVCGVEVNGDEILFGDEFPGLFVSFPGQRSPDMAIAPILNALRNLNKAISLNSGGLKAILQVGDGDSARDDVNSVKVALERALASDARSFAIIPDGLKLESPPKELNQMSSDNEIVDGLYAQVCAAYGVSPEMLGIVKGTNSNISALTESLWNKELLPYVHLLETAFNFTIPKALGKSAEFIEFDISSRLRGNTLELYKALSTATGRPFITTDEARRSLHLPEIEGGDQIVTPLNVLIGGKASPQDPD